MNAQQRSFDFGTGINPGPGTANAPGAGAGSPGSTAVTASYARASGQDRPVRQHLRAARTLSRAIRAQKLDRSKQRATGMAIFNHLLACLEAQEDREGQLPNPPIRS